MSKNTAPKANETPREAPPLDAARDAAAGPEIDLGAPFPSTPRDGEGELERLESERRREDRERFDPVMRAAHALQISALLDLHRLTSHGAGASSDARYLRAATKLGDELAASVERAFEG